jgi:predicted Zn-dependent protease
MNRSLIQGVVIVALFFSIWFSLSQVDWVALFSVEKLTRQTEEKIGEILYDAVIKSEKTIDSEIVQLSMDSLVAKICECNNIDESKIKVQVIQKDEINAWTLPNGHIIICSELILTANNQDELCGVICHEIAHVELNHVMLSLVKEIGLATLLTMTTGGQNVEIIHEAGKVLSSSAFDRSLEREADIKAIEYLTNAKINPGCLADFFYKLAEKEGDTPEYLSWVSTHPDLIERANYIIEYSEGKVSESEPILCQHTWEEVLDNLKE